MLYCLLQRKVKFVTPGSALTTDDFSWLQSPLMFQITSSQTQTLGDFSDYISAGNQTSNWKLPAKEAHKENNNNWLWNVISVWTKTKSMSS